MKSSTTSTLVLITEITALVVGILATFAGPAAAQDEVEDEIDTTVCTIETPEIATDSAETSLATETIGKVIRYA